MMKRIIIIIIILNSFTKIHQLYKIHVQEILRLISVRVNIYDELNI